MSRWLFKVFAAVRNGTYARSRVLWRAEIGTPNNRSKTRGEGGL